MQSIILLLLCAQTVPPSPEAWRDAWIAGATARIERACAQDLASDEPLEARQSRWRAGFLESMGLSPLPERTPLRPVVTGTVETDKFKVEKIHFQSRPGLYVTGNFYLPKAAKRPCPAVLYVCGHATLVREEKGADGVLKKVAYGSKVPYQHHPALFAENGYACLILDTLQLGEIEGTHHGTHRHGRWWWHDRGYTPAGVELWNAIRALDYLESRPEVDRNRLAVTGRSGGGATSWWLGAADPRVLAIVPVAGLADLRAHLIQGELEPHLPGCVTGHCDCMYFHNVAGLDFAHIIALCAPRATLLGNSDKDTIFPVGGYRRPASLARLAFCQAGKPDALGLMETSGGHLDTPELRQGAMGW
ncbi:MAG: alpha/beta hydrolase, partial [Gemmataceae bacterium]